MSENAELAFLLWTQSSPMLILSLFLSCNLGVGPGRDDSTFQACMSFREIACDCGWLCTYYDTDRSGDRSSSSYDEIAADTCDRTVGYDECAPPYQGVPW